MENIYFVFYSLYAKESFMFYVYQENNIHAFFYKQHFYKQQ